MNTPTPQQKLKRALWLAFQASSPMGMGFLHVAAASALTEDSLFEQNEGRDEIYTDYVAGRMMKTSFKLDGEKVVIYPEEPRVDYQSWGSTYKSATELLKAVDESFSG